MLHVGIQRRIDDILRAHHVVRDGLDNVALHQRYMFVRGSVENRVGFQRGHYRVHTRGVPDVGNHRRDLQLREGAAQLSLDLEDLVLAVVHEHQGRGLERRDLPAEFAAD